MNAGRLPLFCDTALAGRIERAEAQLIAAASEAARRRAGTAGFVIPVAGGVASFAGDTSPFNKVAGLGFGGVPDAAALMGVDRLVR
jgi:L-ascorbate metabolism protein UlaG (beta-lactamase superfamily)